MTKKIFSLLVFLFPVFLFAQSAFSDCDKIFTSVQHPPSLKISNVDFVDTLITELKSKNFAFEDNKIVYMFVVTNQSKIDDITLMLGASEQEKILRKAILKFAYLWKPATQNGYDVCAYVYLRIQFIDRNIGIDIIQ